MFLTFPILLATQNKNYNGIIISLIVLFVLSTIVFLIYRHYNRLQNRNPEDAKMAIRKMTELDFDELTNIEIETLKSNTWDFEVDLSDKNLFRSLGNSDFTIRITIKNPNQNNFSLSLSIEDISPLEISNSMKDINGISDIFLKDPFKVLVITKQGDVAWDSMQPKILESLFKILDNKYSWKYEKQTVTVSSASKPEFLNFKLQNETRKCLELGRALVRIQGIVFPQTPEDRFPLGMELEGIYDFSLKKASHFSWEELRPEIEKVFQNFFPAGVEFTGIWETK